MTRAIVFGLVLLALAGCETAKGAGRDLKKVGNAVETVAQDVQKKL